MTTLDLDPTGSTPAWGQRSRPLTMIAIGLLHAVVFWLMLQTPAWREAVEHVAPLTVHIVQS
ncbi:MAG TPA: hypothetical protein VIW70_09270, partial [Rubrivivax sp.]